MYEYKSMIDIDIKTIHDAFIDAFSEYEVKMDMPLEKLQEMMKTRSFDKKYSLGCFDKDKLVGFSLSGYRVINGLRYCYDTATGIRQAYQNKHIGKDLITNLVTMLRKNGIDYFLLEVLENNKSAQKIYLNGGFEITRKLNCYIMTKKFDVNYNSDYQFSYDPKFLESINEQEFNSYEPSWQNKIESYNQCKEKYKVISLNIKGELIGYLIVHKTNGNIMQIGISKNKRDKGFEQILLGEMQHTLKLDKYSLLNVEDDSYIDHKVKDIGFENSVNQYEMQMKIS